MNRLSNIGEAVRDVYSGIEVSLGELVLRSEENLGLAPDAAELHERGIAPDAYHNPSLAGALPARIAVGGLLSAVAISTAKIKGWL